MLRRRARIGRRGPGVMRTMARTAVIAGTATATSRAVSGMMSRPEQRRQQEAYQEEQMADLQAQQDQLAAQQEAMYYQPGTVQQAAGPEPGSLDDQMQQIQKLAQMKDAGLITEEEFTAKKQQILGI